MLFRSLINRPGSAKSFYCSGLSDIEDPNIWAQRAEPVRAAGSWWPHWRAWIKKRSDKSITAPSRLGSHKHKPLGPAPGTYVTALSLALRLTPVWDGVLTVHAHRSIRQIQRRQPRLVMAHMGCSATLRHCRAKGTGRA